MGAAASAESDIESIRTSILEKLTTVKESHPQNLTAKHLTEEFINSLSQDDQRVLYKCTISGLENAGSQLGCYAMTPKDYETFKVFFDKVVREYHGDDTGEKSHKTEWSLVKQEGEGEESKDSDLDLEKLGLNDVSMRIRVGRNLTAYNLPGMMTKEERISFEQKLLVVFDKFIADENLKGCVYSLTPDFNIGEEEKANPNLINDEKYKELVDKHLMFKNMDDDSYLKTAGISSDWPYGRGCYVSEKEDFIVWFGEEDQLRIMCMQVGTKLGQLLEQLHKYLNMMTEGDELVFAKSENYGYITSCPSNLGTGMRASVHIKVPKLLKSLGLAKIKEICNEWNLSVRGLGGEHTAVGDDGTIDLSPRARLFITEAEIVHSLYCGIENLIKKENECEEPCKPEGEATTTEKAKEETAT